MERRETACSETVGRRDGWLMVAAKEDQLSYLERYLKNLATVR